MKVRAVLTLLGLALLSCTTHGAQRGQSLSARASAPAVVRTLQLRVPSQTPAGTAVFIAGDFNGWKPGDSSWTLVRGADGSFAMTLPASVRGDIQFKFTLGSWETVETDSAGGDVPNRTWLVPDSGAAEWRGTVAAWRIGPAPRRRSTAGPSVSLLDTAFAAPQLGGRRRIWLYLPPGYAASSRRYPVLYMHDGQNLFDDSTSFGGEWGVDETLDRLHAEGDPGVIVVGVDNGGDRRLAEYSPWPNLTYGGGDGDAYVEFLVRTLKPWVDEHYRTRPDRLNTGVMGSSMGGLISFYAALKYPQVFGRAGVFSPSLWFAPQIFAYARRATPARPDPRFYFMSGALESSSNETVLDQRRMMDTLSAAGFGIGGEVDTLVLADGRHQEWFWRREFERAYRRLYR